MGARAKGTGRAGVGAPRRSARGRSQRVARGSAARTGQHRADATRKAAQGHTSGCRGSGTSADRGGATARREGKGQEEEGQQRGVREGARGDEATSATSCRNRTFKLSRTNKRRELRQTISAAKVVRT